LFFLLFFFRFCVPFPSFPKIRPPLFPVCPYPLELTSHRPAFFFQPQFLLSLRTSLPSLLYFFFPASKDESISQSPPTLFLSLLIIVRFCFSYGSPPYAVNSFSPPFVSFPHLTFFHGLPLTFLTPKMFYLSGTLQSYSLCFPLHTPLSCPTLLKTPPPFSCPLFVCSHSSYPMFYDLPVTFGHTFPFTISTSLFPPSSLPKFPFLFTLSFTFSLFYRLFP